MTGLPDLEATLDLWISLPESGDNSGSWAHGEAVRVAQRCELPGDQVAALVRFLSSLAAMPWPEGVGQRLVFLPHPALGGVVHDILFVSAKADPADLIDAAPAGQLSHHPSDFHHLDSTGHQSVDFDLVAPGGESDEQVIQGRVVLAVCKASDPTAATIVARASSSHLEVLMGSVIPMQYLLCNTLQTISKGH